ncbi:MAG: STAS domain-containing protein [Pseudomonadota bacterium]
MTIQLSTNGNIELVGSCTVDDAEFLLQALLTNPGITVDWSACESAHGAVIQVLLVAKTRPFGKPVDTFLRDKVGPWLGVAM